MTTLREAAQQALEALDSEHPDIQLRAAVALRKALAQPEPRNQCGETCERAKLCAVCARGLDGAAQTPCDIAEDGVCEVIDCCRNPPQILEALEIGYAAAQAEAAQYHAAMAGYRPERHAAMDADVQKIAKAITAVKAALAQEEQEPVAWIHKLHYLLGHAENMPPADRALALGWEPLYTHPFRREWQGLTDKEIRRMGIETPGQQGGWNLVFARAVEAKLKEKNA
jgi:hypothetical protein